MFEFLNVRIPKRHFLAGSRYDFSLFSSHLSQAGAVKDYIKMMLETEQLKFLVFAHHLSMLQACTEAVIEAKVCVCAETLVKAKVCQHLNPVH